MESNGGFAIFIEVMSRISRCKFDLMSKLLKVGVCFSSGQPRRHLLTTGWSVFVSQKNLVSGDAVLFLRCIC